MANKSQGIVRSILMIDAFAILESREEETSAVPPGKGAENQSVQGGPPGWHTCSDLMGCVSVAPKPWTPVLGSLLLSSFLFSLAIRLRRKPQQGAGEVSYITRSPLLLTERARASNPKRRQAVGAGSLFVAIFCFQVFIFMVLLYFLRAGSIGF